MKKNMLVKLAMALTVIASVSSLAFADGDRGGGDGRGGGDRGGEGGGYRGGGDDGRGGGDRGGDGGWHPQQPPPPPYYGPQPPQPPPVYYPPQPPPERLYTCWVTAYSDGRQYEGQSYNYVEARNIAIEYCKDAGESNVDCDEPSDMWCNN